MKIFIQIYFLLWYSDLYNTNNVKKMADIIINEAIDNGYGVLKDDMTVIVAKVNKI